MESISNFVTNENLVPQEQAINILDRLIEKYQAEMRFGEMEKDREKAGSRDRAVADIVKKYEEKFNSILSRYGCDVQVEKIGNGLFRIPIPHEYVVKKLPEGYGYTGGTARVALLRSLGIDEHTTPRDTDLVRVLDKDVLGMDSVLAIQFSEEDYSHGKGIQQLTENYFKTRDFTINEVLAYGGFVYATKQCLLDTVRGILRFTEFEDGYKDEELNEIEPSDKILAKAVRLASEEVCNGKRFEIHDKRYYKFENIRPFHIALHLNRAFSRGIDVAQRYVDELISLGALSDETRDPLKVAEYLVEWMGRPYVFQHAPQDILNTDEEMYEKFGDIIDKFEK